MKTFQEWLIEHHPEVVEEGKIKDFLRKAAGNAAIVGGILAGAGAGAGLGHYADKINNFKGEIQDIVGGKVGVDNAGDVTRAKENIARSIGDKVGGREVLGAVAGATAAGAGLLSGRGRGRK